jgi:hypothetical protein
MAKQTINSLPGADANFLSDLENFLQNENASRNQIYWQTRPAVISGGLGATDASLTHTISTVVAFVNGFYVTGEAISHTYTATKDTYVYLRDDDSRVITITGYTITYDGNFVFAEYDSGVGSSQPDTPTGCISLFLVVTNGTSIISISDLRFYPINGYVLAEWWGAVGDGSTDDSAAIQAAIKRLSFLGGGTVLLLDKIYAVIEIELASYVMLSGKSSVGTPSKIAGVAQHSRATFLALGSGDLITSPATTIIGAGVQNLSLLGLGAGTPVRGIYLDDSNRGVFQHLTFDNFSEPAIRIDEGVANEFTSIFAQNCLLDTSRASQIGVIDIGSATDNYFDKIEATASLSSISDANLYISAFCLDDNFAANNFFRDCVGEISDIGFYIAGDYNRFECCRADLNYGHGFKFAANAGSNSFSCCHASRNSQETTNTYDGFNLEDGAASNSFCGCLSFSLDVDSKKQRYGFYSALASGTGRNIFSGCSGWTNVSGLFYGVSYLGDSFSLNAALNFTADDATPSVNIGNFFRFDGYTGAVDITDFDDAIPYQIIRVIDPSANGYITIKNNSNIATSTGGDVNLTQNIVYSFISDNGVWRSLD